MSGSLGAYTFSAYPNKDESETPMSTEFQAAIRAFMSTHAVLLKPRNERDHGLTDSGALWHVDIGSCVWVIPDGAVLVEERREEWMGTFATREHQVGLEIEGCACACGHIKNVTVRWDGGLGELIRALTDSTQKAGIPL